MGKKKNKKTKTAYLRVEVQEIYNLKNALLTFNDAVKKNVPNINVHCFDNVNTYLSGPSLADNRNIDAITDTVLIVRNFSSFIDYFNSVISQLKEKGIKEDSKLILSLENVNKMFNYLLDSSNITAANGYIRQLVKDISDSITELSILHINNQTDNEDTLEKAEITSYSNILTDFMGKILGLQDVIGIICSNDKHIFTTFNNSLVSLYTKNAILNSEIYVNELMDLVNGLNSIINSANISEEIKSLLEKLKQELLNSIPDLPENEKVNADSLSIITNIIGNFNSEINRLIVDTHNPGEEVAEFAPESGEVGNPANSDTFNFEDEREHKINAFLDKYLGKALKVTACITALAILFAIYVSSKWHRKNTSNILPSEDESQIQIVDSPESTIGEIIETVTLQTTDVQSTNDTETPFNKEDYVLGDENIGNILIKLEEHGIRAYTKNDIITTIQNLADGNGDNFSSILAEQLAYYVNPILSGKTNDVDTFPAIQMFYGGEDDILISKLQFFEAVPSTYERASHDNQYREIAKHYVYTILSAVQQLFNGKDEWYSQAGESERTIYLESLKHMLQLTALYVRAMPFESPVFITIIQESGVRQIAVKEFTLTDWDELLANTIAKEYFLTPNN